MVIIDLSANETKARAYSQQGHGKQHKPIQRPDTYQRLPEDMQLNTCEQQPVHTFGLFKLSTLKAGHCQTKPA
ncbi:hypothetical protein SuNHUV7_20080 (plasmid) [Pseudoseohaeicola sp. NH-UV-7]